MRLHLTGKRPQQHPTTAHTNFSTTLLKTANPQFNLQYVVYITHYCSV